MSKTTPIPIKYPPRHNIKVIEKISENYFYSDSSQTTNIVNNVNTLNNLDSKVFGNLDNNSNSNKIKNLSFSICLDNKTQYFNYSNNYDINQNTKGNHFISCTPPEKDFLLNKLNTIYPKSDGKWVNSSLVLSCQLCMVSFGLFNRKHHCRACGGVFCYKCCFKMIEIPANFIQKPQPDDSYKQKISDIAKWLSFKCGSLVCNDCYTKINNLKQISLTIKICEFLNFYDLNKILSVSNSWYKAGIHLLSKFREIQYKYTQLFSNWEQLMIWTSRKYFTGHNNWMIILIKSNLQYYYSVGDSDIIYELTDLIDSNKKIISCWNIMCSRKCNIEYDIVDYIDILKFITLLETHTNKLIWTDKLLQEFILLLLQNILELEYHNHTQMNKIQNLALLDKLKSAIPLMCSIFVKLFEINERVDYDFLEQIFNEFLKVDSIIINFYLESKYLDDFNNKDVNHIYFVNFIEKLCDKYKITQIIKEVDSMINFFVQLNKNSETKLQTPILNPLNLSQYITKIISIEKLKSNTQPLLIICVVIENQIEKTIKFILKKDAELRKESIVARVIKLLQERLLKQANKSRIKPFDTIPTYEILMLTKNLAIIEYVENSLTLRMVSNNKFTLQNYILDNNPDKQVDYVKRKFLQSLAISSCLSYILGLGDRHLDNIMINNSGQIFHIDYGYLMDNPATSIVSNPNIKVTSVMIDFLGGIEGKYYKEFTQYIIQVYDILRLYKNLIICNYEILGEEKFLKWTTFKPRLEDRFLSGLSWKDIEVTLINEIENSNSYPSVFADLCHHYKQIINEYVVKKN